MPSMSLLGWRANRIFRLSEVDVQCAASTVLVPPQPNFVDENLRGYVLLLSAHFQGFCRDLYTECAQIVVTKIRVSLRTLMQRQFSAHRKLDHGNPNFQNLKDDFERFGITLNLPAADPVNSSRLNDLSVMNKWRNVAAHHMAIPTGVPPLTLPLLRAWRSSCDGLATSLDAIMYNEVRRILRRAPWIP